ncbi:MAG TPA: TIGR03621 family F420-dependent LLM class oxidoreductase [Methylomirabilota bacterium]|jgi:probable F420-dependent oxidoreductase|nr:TIGR03621 family F420-dependent LLM class oxidoreductase [Methylomirabilota bacterium]
MKPFRFGVNMRAVASRAEWADKARKLETFGYAVLSLPDHLAELVAPMPALASAAAATTSLRIGTMVLNNDLRHPVLVAREAATLDLLSDGRLELGLGAGHMRSEYDQAGLGFDPGSVRVERLAEAVAIIKGLLEGQRVTFTGRHYRVTGHRIHPVPVQRPRPPILIGGSAPRLLTVAAKEADIVGLTGITFRRGGTQPDVSLFRASAADQQLELVRGAAGDRYPQLELNALVQRAIVTDERRRAASELGERWSELSVEEILDSPYVLIGTVDQLVENLQARRERWGVSYYTIFEPHAEAFAPVVACLAGK